MWRFEREVVHRTEKQLNIRAYMRALVYSASMNTSELQAVMTILPPHFSCTVLLMCCCSAGKSDYG